MPLEPDKATSVILKVATQANPHSRVATAMNVLAAITPRTLPCGRDRIVTVV